MVNDHDHNIHVRLCVPLYLNNDAEIESDDTVYLTVEYCKTTFITAICFSNLS